jgi:hypothetical protein
MGRLLLALVTFALVLGVAACADAQVVKTTAANMAVGTFVDITAHFGSSWAGGQALGPSACPANSITQYAAAGVWNPIAHRFQFSGSPHTCGGSNEKAVYYDDPSNTWGELPNPNPSATDPRHSYTQNTINPATGEHYFHDYNSSANLVLCLPGLCTGPTSSSWQTLPDWPTHGFCCDSHAYFPDRNSVVRTNAGADGIGDPWEYSVASRTWKALAFAVSTSGYPGWSGYSARCHCVVIANGGGTFLKYNADATTTTLTQSGGPGSSYLNVATGGGNASSTIAVDPVSGEIVVMPNNTFTIYAFDPGTTNAATGSWRTLGYQMPPSFHDASTMTDTVATSIGEYGVIMYIVGGDATAAQHVWLYKHAPSTPQTTPAAPTNVGAH